MSDSSQTIKGISFPFRIGVKGGVVLSTSDIRDTQHIVESIQQILNTNKFERTMEPHVYSELDASIFDPNDESTKTMIEYQIKESLKTQEPRIQVTGVSVFSKKNEIYANVSYRVLSFDTSNSTNVKVGDINEQ